MLMKEKRNFLNMSSKIKRRLEKIRALNEFALREKGLRHEILFNFFEKAKEASIDFLIINNSLEFIVEYERYCKIMKKGLINGKEIKKTYKLEGNKKFGEIKRRLKAAEFERKIRTKKEAIDYIKKIII